MRGDEPIIFSAKPCVNGDPAACEWNIPTGDGKVQYGVEILSLDFLDHELRYRNIGAHKYCVIIRETYHDRVVRCIERGHLNVRILLDLQYFVVLSALLKGLEK